MADLAIRGGILVTSGSSQAADIHISDGRIEAVGPELSGAAVEIDARGLHVMPAVIDVHLHFNEPGRTEWEGAATGSRALAAGGGALFFDMPLNSTPCTVNAGEFARKRAALEANSVTDFGLWGGLIPGGVGEMADLAGAGAVGFKAFLCDSGLPEFPRADDLTLFEGMREAARLRSAGSGACGKPGDHGGPDARLARPGQTAVREFLASRPVLAELEAIQRATLMAAETGAKLHIVHISTGRGAVLAAEARARGADVSIETCPHYLCFTEEDVERIGAAAKCAPPLRPRRASGGAVAGGARRCRADHRVGPLPGAARNEIGGVLARLGRYRGGAIDPPGAARSRPSRTGTAADADSVAALRGARAAVPHSRQRRDRNWSRC